jgi:hypothetical protein
LPVHSSLAGQVHELVMTSGARAGFGFCQFKFQGARKN